MSTDYVPCDELAPGTAVNKIVSGIFVGNIASHLILMGLGSWARLPGSLGGHLGVSEKASGRVTFPWGPEAGGHHRGSRRSILSTQRQRKPGHLGAMGTSMALAMSEHKGPWWEARPSKAMEATA